MLVITASVKAIQFKIFSKLLLKEKKKKLPDVYLSPGVHKMKTDRGTFVWAIFLVNLQRQDLLELLTFLYWKKPLIIPL